VHLRTWPRVAKATFWPMVGGDLHLLLSHTIRFATNTELRF
jgi:hypothetical protein